MPLTRAELDALRKLTSPTVANAIETFNVRGRNQGFLSGEIRALFPDRPHPELLDYDHAGTKTNQ